MGYQVEAGLKAERLGAEALPLARSTANGGRAAEPRERSRGPADAGDSFSLDDGPRSGVVLLECSVAVCFAELKGAECAWTAPGPVSDSV